MGDGIKVIVEDSGVGIPEKDIPRIFERFYRVDKARSRELGGTGLGLSIVKHIVELHGGSVGVESTEGFGSKFWFILPR
jgi:two-component system phosphate regulon sensor histidine kinase PhoR